MQAFVLRSLYLLKESNTYSTPKRDRLSLKPVEIRSTSDNQRNSPIASDITKPNEYNGIIDLEGRLQDQKKRSKSYWSVLTQSRNVLNE